MKDVNEIRKAIDSTDDVIKDAFVKRMEICKEIAEAKKNSASPVSDPARENAVLFRLTEGLPENYAKYLKELYSVIFSVSKAYQSEIIGRTSSTVEEINRLIKNGLKNAPARAAVACQGVNGAYGGAAAKIWRDVMTEVHKSLDVKEFEDSEDVVKKGIGYYKKGAKVETPIYYNQSSSVSSATSSAASSSVSSAASSTVTSSESSSVSSGNTSSAPPASEPETPSSSEAPPEPSTPETPAEGNG